MNDLIETAIAFSVDEPGRVAPHYPSPLELDLFRALLAEEQGIEINKNPLALFGELIFGIGLSIWDPRPLKAWGRRS